LLAGVLRGLLAAARGPGGEVGGVLHEDFCGSAAVCRAWVSAGDDAARAVGFDLDDDALRAGEASVRREVPAARRDAVMLVRADVTALPASLAMMGADVVFVGNFSLGYLHTRAALLGYLRGAKGRLDRGGGGFGGGVFVCDTYGGASAYALGGHTRQHIGPRGEIIHYTWQHEAADATTAMVTNSISLRVIRDGVEVANWPRAFVYRWRLWSIAELREAMAEVGFGRTGVFSEVRLAPGEPPRPVERLEEDWIVLVAGW
jgi:SAM-dependent methyltransferase